MRLSVRLGGSVGAVLMAGVAVLAPATSASAAPQQTQLQQQVRLRNVLTNNCLTRTGSFVPNLPVYQSGCTFFSAQQRWELQPRMGGYYTVRSTTGNRCLGVSSPFNNTPVRSEACSFFALDQQWRFTPTFNGQQVRNRWSNRCLTAQGFGPFSPVVQSNCAVFFTQAQRWRLS